MHGRITVSIAILVMVSCITGTHAGGGELRAEEGGAAAKTAGATSPEIKKRLELLKYFYGAHRFAVPITEVYDTLPDTEKGFPGRLKETAWKGALRMANLLRSLHNLRPLEYRSEDDVYTEKCSIILNANRVMTHFPHKEMRWYSKEGDIGCQSSNLGYIVFIGPGTVVGPEADVSQWLLDVGVDDAGHRRWLLDPFLKYTSYRRCDAAGLTLSAMKVMFDERTDISKDDTGFIAYPFLEYPTHMAHPDICSFSVLTDRKSTDGNGRDTVDYSGATVRITDGKGAPVTVEGVRADYSGYGLPNVLLWKVPGCRRDERHWVTIDNVSVRGEMRRYTYYFHLLTKDGYERLWRECLEGKMLPR